MTAEKFKRKLAAILSADVKGYSRLMGGDEEWTLRTLNTYREVIAVSYIRLGLKKEARAAAAEILRVNPEFSLEHYSKILPFPQPIADRVIEDLRQAGLK